MRTGSSYIATAIAIGAITLSGCAADVNGNEDQLPSGDDWGDSDKYPELGGAYHSLTALAGTCAWNATTGLMTVSATAGTNQTIIIGARADNIVTVNGGLCAGNSVTKTALKNITVAPTGVATSDTGNQVVILDFINGLFASGLTAGAGIKLNLGTGTDELRIRATTGADVFTFGTPVVSATVLTGTMGIGTTADTNRDIEALGVEAFAISLGAGADILTGAGGASAGAASTVFTAPLTVNGGVGNDVITGGSGADVLSGNDGDDTLNGGLGADTINGDLGNDTVLQGTTADGADVVKCGNESSYVEGAETDVVSYASRTTAVTVTLATAGGTANDGDATFNSNAGELDDIDSSCEGVTGGSGNDVITGDSHKNVLTGGAGDDTLKGFLADDVLNGGLGDDTFDEGTAFSGADTFNGGAGTDTVDYHSRTAVNIVIAMDATATSGEGSELDTVAVDVENALGGPGIDTITGNASDNVITGGLGNDILSGGAGNDIFKEGGGANVGSTGNDTFNGDAGTDSVDYTLRTTAIRVDIGAGTTNDGDFGDGELDDVTSTVENVWGSLANANTLTGDANDNELTGGAGADTLVGGAGSDTLDGGSGGSDTLTCGADDDIAFGFGALTKTDCEL